MVVPDSKSATGNHSDSSVEVLRVDLFGSDDFVKD